MVLILSLLKAYLDANLILSEAKPLPHKLGLPIKYLISQFLFLYSILVNSITPIYKFKYFIKNNLQFLSVILCLTNFFVK